MKRKILFLLLVLALLLCLFSACSSKDMAGQCGINLRWTYSDKNGTLTITGSGPMYDYTYPQPWASVQDKIVGVSLPQGLTHIGNYSFYRCAGLQAVAIPSSVTSIGDHAFSECTELTSLILPNNDIYFGQGAFDGCPKLIVPVQNPVEHDQSANAPIHTEAPQATAQPVRPTAQLVSSTAVPVQPTAVPAPPTAVLAPPSAVPAPPTAQPVSPTAQPASPAANDRCGDDLSWSFSSSTGQLTIMGSGNMYDFDWDGQPWKSVLDQITSISLSEDLTSIGKDAFRDCRNLTSVTIPSGVTAIDRNAFRGCERLASVTIPNSVTSIGSYAFCDCKNLPFVTLPKRLTSIEDCVFFGCSHLASVTIPDTVTEIGTGAFRDCPRLASITIPKGVTSIQKMTFSGCADLDSVTVPNGVTSIGEYAFYGCKEMESISIPKTVKTIGWSAFDNCSSLKTVYYGGKSSQRSQIDIEESNNDLEDASWRYSTVTGLSITREPVDAEVRNGEMASFAVRTKGNVNSFQWYYRTGPKAKWIEIESGTTAVLTFTAKPAMDGYQYVCNIENDYGTLTTDVVTLTLELYPPTIDTQPKDVEVISGETATFTVKATDADAYQWYYRTKPNGKWAKISGGTKATLTVKTKYAKNGYQYACDVKNDDGKVTTNAATLTVIKQLPVITVQPKDVTVNSGETAKLTVTATGAESYQWLYRTSPKEKWVKTKTGDAATYTVNTKMRHNGYQYICEISNDDGKVTTNVVTLTVIAMPPKITTQPKDVTVKLTEKAVFRVAATGAESYQWSYRTSSKGEWIKIKDGTKAALTVTPEPEKNGYEYSCVLKNDDGSVRSDIVKLTIDAVIPKITVQPQSVTAKKNASVTFSVEATDAVSFQWYYRKKSSAKWTLLEGATKSSYTTTAKSNHSGYQYRCAVSSVDCKIESAIATLKVK